MNKRNSYNTFVTQFQRALTESICIEHSPPYANLLSGLWFEGRTSLASKDSAIAFELLPSTTNEIVGARLELSPSSIPSIRTPFCLRDLKKLSNGDINRNSCAAIRWFVSLLRSEISVDLSAPDRLRRYGNTAEDAYDSSKFGPPGTRVSEPGLPSLLRKKCAKLLRLSWFFLRVYNTDMCGP